MKVLDCAGKEVKVGSYVVYSVLLDRSAGLSFGRVVSMHWEAGFIETKKTPRVRVQGAQFSFGKPHLKGTGTLLFPNERMLVIEASQVPARLLRLLLDAGEE